jgi:superfamily II DNA or RNA helicase
MSIILRPYQQDAVNAVLNAIDDGYTRILYTLATAAGKTSVFAELTKIFTKYHHKRVLILVHRRELLTQAYRRVKDHCEFDDWQIGIEIAETRAHSQCKVIVASVQTIVRSDRLHGWIPDIIISDEGHHAAATSWQTVFNRYFVNEGKCMSISCTATAKRSDRASLYALNPDGSTVEIEDKKGRKLLADAKTSVFEKLVYEYDIVAATNDGWLCPIRRGLVETETDLTQVSTSKGDYAIGELAKAVNNGERTLLAVNAWKQYASDRQTLVFAADVDHAYAVAECWRDAGYTARALCGDDLTNSDLRENTLEEFRRGELQVLVNFAAFTEGTDLPTCSCVVMMRPTQSWSLFCQMVGRGNRVLPNTVDGLATKEERKAAIARSAKPDSLVIDLVDVTKQHTCSVPSIYDLPAKLDMEGHTLSECKQLLDEFAEVKDQVIGEAPMSFTELKVRMEQVDLLRTGKVHRSQEWKVTPTGDYRCVQVPVGYQANLKENRDGSANWTLEVSYNGQQIWTKEASLMHKATGQPYPRERFLNRAHEHIDEAIKRHRESLPKMPPSLVSLGNATVDLSKLCQWSAPTYRTKDGERVKVFMASPSSQFWKLWREHKEALKSSGIGLRKNGEGEWEVNWWQNRKQAELVEV